MSAMIAFGHCVSCGAFISFNPTYVPSITVNGSRGPVCRACFERWKTKHNKPDHPLHPDAYGPEET